MNKPMYKQTGEGKWHFLMPSERKPMNKTTDNSDKAQAEAFELGYIKGASDMVDQRDAAVAALRGMLWLEKARVSYGAKQPGDWSIDDQTLKSKAISAALAAIAAAESEGQ